VADELLPAARCEDAEADGFPLPAALTTTMAAMAATTNPTGIRAVRTGWRVRRRAVGAGVGRVRTPVLAPVRDLDEFLLLDVGLDLGLGRAGRGDPDGDFDMVMVFSLHWAEPAQWRTCSEARVEAGNGCRD
jgi:hypothetical protein